MPVWAFVWLGIAILAAILEGVTVQLVSVWFAIAGVITAVAALLGLPVYGQMLLFAFLTLALLIGTRPFVQKILHQRRTPTNSDALIGKTAVILVGAHRAQVEGLDWAIRTQSESVSLEEGQKVRILAIEGVTLVVEPVSL